MVLRLTAQHARSLTGSLQVAYSRRRFASSTSATGDEFVSIYTTHERTHVAHTINATKAGYNWHYVFTYTTCNVLGLCKRLVRCILLIWLTYLDVNSHRTCEPD